MWRKTALLLAFAVLSMSLLPTMGQTQTADVKDLFSGNTIPLTLKLKDLDGDWRRFAAGGGGGLGDMGGLFGTMMSAMMGVMGGGSAGNAYFTKGQTVVMGGETFLVTYKVKTKSISSFVALMAENPAGPPKPEKLTLDSALSLSLLNLHATPSFNDIRPFDMKVEIEENDAFIKAMEKGNGGLFGNGGAAPAPPEQEGHDAPGTAPATAIPDDASSSNLKQLGLAVMMYTQDYDEVLPPMKDSATVKRVVMPYIKNETVFTHPETREPYRFNAILSKHKLASISEPHTMVLAYEARPVKGVGSDSLTRAVVFLDGHSKRISENEWPRLKKASKIPD